MFKVPERYRSNEHPNRNYHSDASYGNNGCFAIPLGRRFIAWVLATDGSGWEHVSVSIKISVNGKIAKEANRTPTWEEMCEIKDLFWDEEDCVIQYHPPKKDYVSHHHYALHLWKKIGFEQPVPDPSLIGLKMK